MIVKVTTAYPGFFRERAKYFIKKNILSPSLIYCPWIRTDKVRWAENILILKQGLVLASAHNPNNIFFSLEQRHTFWNFISGIFRGGM